MTVRRIDPNFGVEWVFPTRYVRTRRLIDRAMKVDKRYGIVTFAFDRLDDARLWLIHRAAARRVDP